MRGDKLGLARSIECFWDRFGKRLAEAQRLRGDFEKATDIADKLGLGRSIEGFLDRAAEYDRRVAEK